MKKTVTEKKKKRFEFKYFLLAGLVIAIAVMIVLITYLYNKREKNGTMLDITLTENGVTQKTLSFKDLSLTPGEHTEYTVNVSGGIECLYAVSLAFEGVDGSTLQSFVTVTISVGEETLAQASLASLFAGETIEFERTVSETKPMALTIRYDMPLSVGDEAQGATAMFDLVLTASTL